MKKGPPSYVREAIREGAMDDDPSNFALEYGLDSALRYADIDRVAQLVDPAHAGGRVGGEPGWYIERQMVPGEARRRVARLRVECRNHLPRPPIFTEPAEDAGPDKTWPAFARFKAELAFPQEFGDPKHPIQYYDAATFEGFLQKILAVYVKHHPEEADMVQQILNHAHYWVEHDRKPG
jgi:hypothetical protein